MSDYIERKVVDFKIHNLTEEQFQELKEQGKIDPNAVYCTPDTTKERLDALETMKQDKATAVNYDNITNCITHIPQDIKLELDGTKHLYAWTTENDTLYTDTTQAGAYDIKVYNASGQNVTPAKGTIYVSSDGTYIWCDVDTISKHYRDASKDKTINSNDSVILKAGSKVYVPNGPGVFDVVTIQNDVTTTVSYNGTCTLYYNPSNNQCSLFNSQADASGTTDPTYTANFYNTEQNLVKRFNASVLSTSGLSFPLCRCTTTTDGVSSIDVVFNGFGYIGSTIFALPGVKGLIPNGRNEDGTLKNSVLTTSRVFTTTGNATSNNVLLISNWSVDRLSNSNYFYDEEKNIIINKANNIQLPYVMYGSNVTTNGVISNFKTNHTFRAVDYNDTEYMARQAMPEPSSYVAWTLGATGTNYTAPADGYFVFTKTTNAANQFVAVASGAMREICFCPESGGRVSVMLPCAKGQSINIAYTAGGVTSSFGFVYANGAK